MQVSNQIVLVMIETVTQVAQMALSSRRRCTDRLSTGTGDQEPDPSRGPVRTLFPCSADGKPAT